MARGRGRGRGRGRKIPLMTIGSSVGEPSDLEYEEEKEAESNGTLNVDAENFVDTTRNTGGQSKGKEKNTNELWTNMFKNNRAANNGMNLTYFPPQIVDGQTMVQLEEDEVQVVEDKWKCALIAYVIGECPGYNTMHRYITMNWAVVTKLDQYQLEMGLKALCISNLLHCLLIEAEPPTLVDEVGLLEWDFNALLTPQDRLVGANVSLNEVKDFADCVKDIGVIELQWQGHYYSWTNKQHDTDRISSRIDRVFGNYEWMEKWGHVTIECGNPCISDHYLMQVTMQITQHNVKVKFKFFNVWTEHDSFMSLVESVWKQDYGKGSMKKRRVYALRQKSRTRWIQLGDTNNKYFSAIIKERTQKKQIRCITSLTGHMLYEPQDIQTEFVQFYKGLMGSSVTTLPAIDVQVMKRGPTLSRQQRIDLCANITKEEVTAGLQSIGNDKALGIDGFNAYFFKYTWKTIKEDIIDAVQSFFKTGKIYKPVNCTLVTLIPKVQNPKTVKEYRPIACCTVLYKVISKVLSKRLHDVIQSVICDSQARLIPWRKISDNILLAHEL
ncbi:hypothetical protein MTR67_001213 [Solanum verrucosum]|uniref:Reverse transcriptase n=1 Tax=Solanum verrucosum TaxID=315347 RepID=A0AAF0PMV5_SOLVR|nr:hypothetical protein MTR67_001213 [Solanum verrucosum]